MKIHVPWVNNFEEQFNVNNDEWIEIYSQFSNIIPGYVDVENANVELSESEEEEEEEGHDLVDNVVKLVKLVSIVKLKII